MLKTQDTQEIERLVGIYTRVSTEEQGIQGLSIENQLERSFDHMRIKGWKKYKHYKDFDTGYKASRKSYQKMLEDIRQKKINTVMILRLNRIFRNLKEYLEMLEFFKKHNTSFVCLTENFDTTTPSGWMASSTIMAVSEFERQQISIQTSEVQERIMFLKEKRLNYALPKYVYTPVREVVNRGGREKLLITHYNIKPSGRAIVKMAFRRYIAKIPPSLISEEIKKKFGVSLKPLRISDMLRNPLFTGRVVRKGLMIKKPELRIITDADFEKVQEIIKAGGLKGSYSREVAKRRRIERARLERLSYL